MDIRGKPPPWSSYGQKEVLVGDEAQWNGKGIDSQRPRTTRESDLCSWIGTKCINASSRLCFKMINDRRHFRPVQQGIQPDWMGLHFLYLPASEAIAAMYDAVA